jgi:hypothetical protein
MTGKTSSLSSGPTSKRKTQTPSCSVRKTSPHQSTLLSSSSEQNADSGLRPATRTQSRNPTGTQPPKNIKTSALAAENVQSYSFGTAENILSGREPKLPRSLLDGRRSDRMVQLKGRVYNEEDWFDDSKPEEKA